MKTRLGDLLFFLVLLGIAVAYGVDHLLWVRADVIPQMDSDSSLHGGAMAGGWFRVQHAFGIDAIYAPGTYPPFVHWVTWAWLAFASPSLNAMREAQSIFSFVMVIGCGLLARRLGGGWAGLMAAGVCLCFPTMYWQRSIVLLALAETAMLALAYALLVDPGRPARGAAGWAKVVAGGVVMGCASLTHVSMLYWLAATSVTQAMLAGVAVFRREEGARAHVGALGVYYGVAALIGAPWYVRSRAFIFGALRNNYEIETWDQSPYDVPVFFGWLKLHYMASPVAWAFVVGILCLPVLVWKRPQVLPVLAGLVGGYLGVLSYPHVHARYFLPLAPMILVVVTAPIALLSLPGPLQRTRTAMAAIVALGFAAYGGVYTMGWHWSAPGKTTADARVDGAISAAEIRAERARPWHALVAMPTRHHLYAPRPTTGLWPIDEVIATVIAELKLPAAPPTDLLFGSLPDAPVVWALSPHFAERTTTFEYVVRGIRPPVVVEERVPLGELERLEKEKRARYILYTENMLKDPPGTTELARWPVFVPERIVTQLVFARVDGPWRPVYEQMRPRTVQPNRRP